MHSFVSGRGGQVRIGSLIGKGGEASVFAVQGDTQKVAKIYSGSIDNAKQAKLAAMCRLSQPDLLKFTAWPMETLHPTQGGPVVGITMPKIARAKEIHCLYSPAHRKDNFPAADWRFLVGTALNSAIAFSVLHSKGIVIGDVNQGNILVTPEAKVRFIDCDSFQMELEGQLYRCNVGVSHFQPPEMQAASFALTTRTENHDNFGLAVLIFHLLFLGRHPFSVKPLTALDVSIEEAIKRFAFPYGANARSKGVAPPPQSLSLSSVTPRIGSYLERAFGEPGFRGGRPTASQWVAALKDLLSQIVACPDDAAHFYCSSLQTCPWCAIINAGGVDFFVTASITKLPAETGPCNPDQAWLRITQVPSVEARLQQPADITVGSFVPLPPPVRSGHVQKLLLQLRIIRNVGIAASLLVVAWPLVAVVGFLTFFVFGLAHWVIAYSEDSEVERRSRQHALRQAERALDDLVKQQRQIAETASHAFSARKEALRTCYENAKSLAARKASEIDSLSRMSMQRQLSDYLRKTYIKPGRIPGVGANRIAALASFGIETAADVDRSRILAVPGFGPQLTDALCIWKAAVTREFRFNPSIAVLPSDIQAIEHRYAMERSRLERELRGGAAALEQLAKSASEKHNSMCQQVSIAMYDCECARLNLLACC